MTRTLLGAAAFAVGLAMLLGTGPPAMAGEMSYGNCGTRAVMASISTPGNESDRTVVQAEQQLFVAMAQPPALASTDTVITSALPVKGDGTYLDRVAKEGGAAGAILVDQQAFVSPAQGSKGKIGG